jgi:hypothetical protein
MNVGADGGGLEPETLAEGRRIIDGWKKKLDIRVVGPQSHPPVC